MKEDDTKEFAAKLGRPDLSKIDERAQRRCREDEALIEKHLSEHRNFLSAVKRRSKSGLPVYPSYLYMLATETVEMLDELILGFEEDERESFREIFTRKNISWPVNIESKAPGYLTNKANYVFDELELGVNSIFNMETFKHGGGDISKASKIVVRRFMRAILKCQHRARYAPSKQRSEMECLAISLDELDSLNASHWFAVIVEWIMHYGKWDKDQVTMTAQQVEILGSDISMLGNNAEVSGNRDGDVCCYDEKVKKELRKNLWRAFLQCIKPSIREALSTKIMKEGKFEKVDPKPPSKAQIDEVVELLSSKEEA